MPVYEYACPECGYHLEARQRFSDPPLTKCPKCGFEGLERLISNSNFALKGGGWYADGYGPGSDKSESKSSSTTTSDSGTTEKKADKKKADDKKATPKSTSSSSTD